MTLHHLKKNGFTLIELVAVIIILGILGVVAAPKLLSLRTDAKISTLETVGAAMRSGLSLVHSQAAIEGKDQGDNTIMINGTEVPLYYGAPSVRGRDSFVKINQQVKAWLEIDSVDRNTARNDRNAAPFFTDKSTRNNQIYLFFTADYDQKSVNFKCHIKYENPESATPTGSTVTVETSQC